MKAITNAQKQERNERGYQIATLSTITREGASYRVPSSDGKHFYSVEAYSRELQQLVFKRELCKQILDRNFLQAAGRVLSFPLTWLRRAYRGNPACTCPDHRFRHVTCKHIAAVAFLLTDVTATREKGGLA